MRFDTSQHMKLGQQMKLAPRMIQSMEILQMPLNELEERIEQELESNVTLEVAEDSTDRRKLQEEQRETEREARDNERPMKVDEKKGESDFERLDSFESSNPELAENAYSNASADAGSSRDFEPSTYSRSRSDGERDGKMDAMAAAPARSASLQEQLRDQWALADVPPEIRSAGDLILTFIEDDGYLRTPLETIADRAPGAGPKPSVDLLGQALSELQSE